MGIEQLRPHPRNYRRHPEAQLVHIRASLKQHGFYRKVVVARDLTILAGHGLVEAARSMGIKLVPVFQIDLDPLDPRALKVLAGDNEIGRFAEQDDRMLAEMLMEIAGPDVSGLLGTGYDELMLARMTAQETPDQAAMWGGMPEFNQGDEAAFRKIIVHFKSDEDADVFASLLGQSITKKTRSIWYPEVENANGKFIRYSAKQAGE